MKFLAYCGALFVALSMSLSQAAPDFEEMARPAATSAADHEPLKLRFEDGALSGAIVNRALWQVLCELARVTGAHFILPGGVPSDRHVSVKLSATPLPIALQRILQGASFMTYPGAEGVTVKLLSNANGSSDRRGRREQALQCGRGVENSTVLGPAAGSSGSELQLGNAPVAPARATLGAEASTPSDSDPKPARGEAEQQAQAVEAAADALAEQGSRDARLEQAFAELESGDVKRQAEALNLLLDLKDRRASEALVALASVPSSGDGSARVRVVNTLWRHAADLEFSDDVSIDGLRALAEDSDARVAGIAREALEDMEQHRQKNAPHP